MLLFKIVKAAILAHVTEFKRAGDGEYVGWYPGKGW